MRKSCIKLQGPKTITEIERMKRTGQVAVIAMKCTPTSQSYCEDKMT